MQLQYMTLQQRNSSGIRQMLHLLHSSLSHNH